MEAFGRAISANHPVELDVRQTGDGKLIVFHDSSLSRMTGKSIDVSKCDWDEIKNLRLLASGQRIPLLDSVLELINGRVPVLIEIKNEGLAGKIERGIAEVLDRYSGPFAIQSFNPLTVLWFRRRRPGICRGQLAGDFRSSPEIGKVPDFILRNMYLNFISRPHFVAYDVSAGDRLFFEKMKSRIGVPLILWTVNSKDKLALCRELGINFIFEPCGM